MTTPAASAISITLPNGGPVYRAFGEEIIVHLSGAQTGGRLAMFTTITPPGGGPPPHYHEREDEWFLVQDGQAEFLINQAWQAVPVGTAVFLPRGIVHTFRNVGTTPLRSLVHTAPSGFEIFFARCADVWAKPGPPDMASLMAIGAEHGIHIIKG